MSTKQVEPNWLKGKLIKLDRMMGWMIKYDRPGCRNQITKTEARGGATSCSEYCAQLMMR